MAATAFHAYAQSRLLRDFQEVLENPLPNVVGRPLDDNIFVWHVNVRADDDNNQLTGATFHIKLVFPPNYPNEGPALQIGSPLPHPNIYQAGLPGQWQLSLWDCIPGFKGWSSAYSAQSILLQLQTFLLREDLQYNDQNVSHDMAVNVANAFTCSECSHKGTDPFPAFLTQEELEGAAKRRTKLLVFRPAISQVLRSLKQSDHALQQDQSRQSIEQSTLSNKASQQLDHALQHIQASQPIEQGAMSKYSQLFDVKQGTNVNTLQQNHNKREQISLEKDVQPNRNHKANAEHGWQMVTRGKHCLNTSINRTSKGKIDDAFVSLVAETQKPTKTTSEQPIPDTASCIVTSTSDHTSTNLKPASFSKSKASKAARKTRARSMRRQAARSDNANGAAEIVQDESGQVEAPSQSGIVNKDGTATEIVKDELRGVKAMGLFGLLPLEALTMIISQLATSDLASFSMTCHGINEACEDGFVWKEILYRQFPATSLQAATMNDWRHAYLVESSNITSSLQCFHSKVTFDKDVLGYPITYTVNPRTKCVDYIEVSFDLLSQTAYDEQKVRTTANNEKFDLLLPLYINPDHFERGLPLLMRTARALCPDMKSYTFKPEMVLSFMPKLLNTMVVLLSGKGISASDRATDGFCSLHRLFIALCDRFKLWKEAERQVLKFVSSEKARSKAECPSLGDFISLLTVCSSKGTSWENVIRPWINELFDRGVIWVCKEHPNLVEKLKVDPKVGGIDEELLNLSWDGRKIGLRLAIFYYGFIHILARPPGVSLHKVAASYDALYGMASLPMKKRMHDFGKKTMGVNNWPTFFKATGLQAPSKEYMTGWLRQSWFSSLQKGYHTNNTNFTAIQKHGVSKILLKGETAHLGVNSTVFMQEKWRYEGDTKFLDASCLLYGFDGRFVAVVDYCHMVWAGITHSGDEIDHGKSEGTHKITLRLMSLGTDVKEMYFTMSGWQGVKLKDICLPFVQLVEQKTGKELCEYHLEDKNLGEHRSVIMCRLYRKEPSQSASWHVEAIGHLGAGAADDYGPIMAWIEQRIQRS